MLVARCYGDTAWQARCVCCGLLRLEVPIDDERQTSDGALSPPPFPVASNVPGQPAPCHWPRSRAICPAGVIGAFPCLEDKGRKRGG